MVVIYVDYGLSIINIESYEENHVRYLEMGQDNFRGSFLKIASKIL